jgi:hypothetical protein
MPPRALDRRARMNPTTVFLAALVLVLLGLFLPDALGGVLLLALVGGLAAVLTRTWRLQPPGLRALRVLVLVLVGTVALTKIF